MSIVKVILENANSWVTRINCDFANAANYYFGAGGFEQPDGSVSRAECVCELNDGGQVVRVLTAKEFFANKFDNLPPWPIVECSGNETTTTKAKSMQFFELNGSLYRIHNEVMCRKTTDHWELSEVSVNRVRQFGKPVTPDTKIRANSYAGWNKWFKSIVPGSRIIAVGTRDVRELTYGKVYTAIYGCEEGIFETRPFVTVISDEGKKFSCHLARFIPENDLTTSHHGL